MKIRIIKLICKSLWIILMIISLSVAGVFIIIKYNVYNWSGGLPSLQDLERPETALSSELISADGVSFGKYFRKNRISTSYDKLSPYLINTLLVTEDIRFNNHSGIDLKAILRAAVGKLTFSFNGGGSTITMQLAENLYRTNSDMQGTLYKYRTVGQIITKIKEWIIAVQLEKSYTKKEIITMYLNTIEFGSNSYGINVASKTFFNKLPSQLNYSESSVLVGLINAPTRWSPVLNPNNALRKRTEILWNLYKYNLITEDEFKIHNEEPITLSYLVENQNKGSATYFRTVVRNYLLQWAEKNGYDLFEDGLKIYTTIDSKLQKYAEEAVQEQMKNLQKIFDEHWNGENPWIDENGNEIPGFLENVIQRTSVYKSLKNRFGDQNDSIEFHLNKKKRMIIFSRNGEIDTVLSSYDSLAYYKNFLQAGFISMNPKNGHIKAWVGGINHKYFKFDHVKSTKRQPGSVFKPIIYTAAIANGFSPCYPIADVPVTFDLPGQDPPTWSPPNASKRFTGNILTLKQALAKSVNSVTASIMKEIKPFKAVEYAKNLGIESPLDPVPSLCLGAGGDVSLYEMVGAYSTFVNKGTYIKPFFISRIEDKYGHIIQEFVPEEREAIHEETAYIMLNMLMGTTTERGGTAKRLHADILSNNEVGAKTGTTNNASDGWFIGVTKDLVSGAWVGGDDRSIHFKNWSMGQGARTAMPIWQDYMLKVYADYTLGYEKGPFEQPSQKLNTIIDCDLYIKQSQEDTIEYNIINEDDFH